MKGVLFILLFVTIVFSGNVFSQDTSRQKILTVPTDSATLRKNPFFTPDTVIQVIKGDTVKKVVKHDPGKATLRSLILPGWGQAYNREYWKIPIVYGAIGTAAGIFVYNNMWYKRSKNAFEIRITGDTSRFSEIHSRLEPYPASSLQVLRNSFRRDRDFSALWFILTWGLNIVDATVFGHLKEFDVSDDLSFKINPSINKNSKGFSLVLGYKSPVKHRLATF